MSQSIEVVKQYLDKLGLVAQREEVRRYHLWGWDTSYKSEVMIGKHKLVWKDTGKVTTSNFRIYDGDQEICLRATDITRSIQKTLNHVLRCNTISLFVGLRHVNVTGSIAKRENLRVVIDGNNLKENPFKKAIESGEGLELYKDYLKDISLKNVFRDWLVDNYMEQCPELVDLKMEPPEIQSTPRSERNTLWKLWNQNTSSPTDRKS